MVFTSHQGKRCPGLRILGTVSFFYDERTDKLQYCYVMEVIDFVCFVVTSALNPMRAERGNAARAPARIRSPHSEPFFHARFFVSHFYPLHLVF